MAGLQTFCLSKYKQVFIFFFLCVSFELENKSEKLKKERRKEQRKDDQSQKDAFEAFAVGGENTPVCLM